MAEKKMTRRDLFVFALVNALVAVFYDAIWLLGYRIQALDDWSASMGNFQFVLWFFSFFVVAFLFLSEFITERLVIKCIGIALFFTFLLFIFMGISTVILVPYIDPWF